MKSATAYLKLTLSLSLTVLSVAGFSQVDLKQMSLGFQSIYGQYIAQNNLGLFITQQYTYGTERNQNFYIDFGASYGVDPRFSQIRSSFVTVDFESPVHRTKIALDFLKDVRVYEITKATSFHLALGVGLSYVRMSMPTYTEVTPEGIFEERTRFTNFRPQGLIAGTLKVKVNEEYMLFASYGGRAGFKKTTPYEMITRTGFAFSSESSDGSFDLWGVYRIGVTKLL